MKSVRVNASRKYDVSIGAGLLNEIPSVLASLCKKGKLLVVTDDTVDRLYADRVLAALNERGFEANKFVFPHGEQNKTLATFSNILDTLADCGFTRTDGIVALGGGVTGDVAGFAAATYMRGIYYAQVPTTLLAGIDSSVGGKTAVDLAGGKNLMGAFHQPVAVIFDTDTLKTLPKEYIQDGLGEGLKYAALCGGELMEIMESGLNEKNFERFLELCVSCKRDIVEADERESGVRRLLNLGHTLGHALEKVSDFSISHGKAVADGMMRITEIAVKNKLLSADDGERMLSLCKKYGMKIHAEYPTEALLEPIKSDKKRAGDKLHLVIPRGIGKCETLTVAQQDWRTFFCGD
ncbi:MAG: 3-dehydroquinate synthase [Clostridiales bacterium]|nr:3-dehydroquinate synthase [Clostridiales bacterium]